MAQPPQNRYVLSQPVFRALLAARLVSASLAPILDCDEVFNYWDPTHYLTHGFGLQTWEYSPVYAIRSWAYAGLHALILETGRHVFVPILAKFGGSDGAAESVALFYFLRSVFAIVAAIADTKLYLTIKEHIDPVMLPEKQDWYDVLASPSSIYTVLTLTATAMFHASVAYLPSSFAMVCTTFSLVYLVRYVTSSDSADLAKAAGRGLSWIAVGAIVGWPFALAIGGVWAVHVALGWLTFGWPISNHFSQFLPAVVRPALKVVVPITAAIVAIDSYLYGKLTIVPWNIVAYNVLQADATSGPDIFGTEPWHYYLQNLALNLNFGLLFALVSPLAVLLNKPNRPVRWALLLAPSFIWLAIFTAQPHKEERFMYVSYSSFLLNAAIGLSSIISFISRIVPMSKLLVKTSLVFIGLTAFILVSVSRSAALATYYRAPVEIFSKVSTLNVHKPTTVCVGREWYRFPSSYFLQDNMRLKFISSGFDGLLPGSFREDNGYSGIWEVPEGMNNRNKRDPGKIVPISTCNYVVDSTYPVDSEAGEINFSNDTDWQQIECFKMLDSGASTGIQRILYIPEDLEPIVNQLAPSNLVWTDLCLYKQLN
ncbi:uncharacterized protein SAPINGB_P002392 [Magnusiomyces paraingens]|uniref:Mannosyltransferase n=1 Tax=Magnusiomyces paraingens TaxID=2606893 RepID=A0A5E8BDN7_9ASCO|nr:uncharacterized protein SAPINGB_P002392 [Saprochaete ingens]VVT49685.1 unnamed protein product [Saprochaete ingens]